MRFKMPDSISRSGFFFLVFLLNHSANSPVTEHMCLDRRFQDSSVLDRFDCSWVACTQQGSHFKHVARDNRQVSCLVSSLPPSSFRCTSCLVVLGEFKTNSSLTSRTKVPPDQEEQWLQLVSLLQVWDGEFFVLTKLCNSPHTSQQRR